MEYTKKYKLVFNLYFNEVWRALMVFMNKIKFLYSVLKRIFQINSLN